MPVSRHVDSRQGRNIGENRQISWYRLFNHSARKILCTISQGSLIYSRMPRLGVYEGGARHVKVLGISSLSGRLLHQEDWVRAYLANKLSGYLKHFLAILLESNARWPAWKTTSRSASYNHQCMWAKSDALENQCEMHKRARPSWRQVVRTINLRHRQTLRSSIRKICIS